MTIRENDNSGKMTISENDNSGEMTIRKGKHMNKQKASRQERAEEQAPEDAARRISQDAAPESPDTIADPTDLADPADSALAERLAKAEAQREEYLNLAQRVQADFDNYRRRNQAVRAEAIQDGVADTLIQLLPVVDSLERALDAVPKAAQAEQAEQTAAAEQTGAALRDGVEMVLRQFREIMGKLGVTEIDRPGQPFDPELENAVLQGAPEEGEPGTVCQVLQKGYRMPARVLRHAMVKVVAG
jgi:molecular chaperone GrpE